MGKIALKAVKAQNAKKTGRLFKKHLFCFVAFIVFYLFTKKESKEFKSIFDKLVAEDKNETSLNIKSTLTEAPKRNLRFQQRDQELDDMLLRFKIPDDVS